MEWSDESEQVIRETDRVLQNAFSGLSLVDFAKAGLTGAEIMGIVESVRLVSRVREKSGWQCVAGNNGMACSERSPHPQFWGCGPVNEEEA